MSFPFPCFLWIFLSVQFSCSVMSDSLWPHGLQHARPPCPSPTPGACSNSCPSSWWCHPTISSSVVPFFSCLQSFPASGSLQTSQFFTSGGQSIGASALALDPTMKRRDWSPLGLTGWILQSKGLSRVFSSTTVQKQQFFHFLSCTFKKILVLPEMILIIFSDVLRFLSSPLYLVLCKVKKLAFTAPPPPFFFPRSDYFSLSMFLFYCDKLFDN